MTSCSQIDAHDWLVMIWAAHDRVMQALDWFTTPEDHSCRRMEIASEVEVAILDLDAELHSLLPDSSIKQLNRIQGALRDSALTVEALGAEVEEFYEEDFADLLLHLSDLYEECALGIGLLQKTSADLGRRRTAASLIPAMSMG